MQRASRERREASCRASGLKQCRALQSRGRRRPKATIRLTALHEFAVTLKRQFIKAAAILTSGNALGRLLALAATVVLARTLARDQFGIGSALALSAVFVRMTSDLGFDRLIVQSRDGADDGLGRTGQSLMLIRGLIMSLLLLLLSGPMAAYFGIPEYQWGFQILAITPLLQGLRHRDIARLQRELRFGPTIAVSVIPEIVVLAGVYFLARWLGDFRVFLVIGIARSAIALLVSHWCAEVPIRFGWERRHVARFLSFGWPLLINGVLMFAVLQGDRAVVGRFFSLEVLASFSVAASLTMVPSMLAARTISSLLLPLLASAQCDASRFNRLYADCCGLQSLLCLTFGSAYIAFGYWAVVLIYGDRYASAAPLVIGLGVMQSLRLMRVTPNMAAMALGDTQNAMIANGARLSGLAAAFLVAAEGMPLIWVPVMGIAGEIVANLVAIASLSIRHGRPLRASMSRFAAVTLAIVGFAVLMHVATLPSVVRYATIGVAIIVLGSLNVNFALQHLGRRKTVLPLS